MKTFIALFILVAASSISLADETAATAAAQPPDMAFGHRLIQVGNVKISAAVASTTAQMERGLMYRKNPLAENEGMLFTYGGDQSLSFWMKNTYIPLSIGFFNGQKKLVDVQEMAATSEVQTNPPTYQSKAPAMFALEMAPGWFSRHNFGIGTILKLDPNAPATTTTTPATTPAKAVSTKAAPAKAGH
jgi:uncharacterized membrane protein (UPF0127 family)